MGWSIKKPLGGKNSFVRRTARNPIGFALGGPVGALINDYRQQGQRNAQQYKEQQARERDAELAAQGDLAAMAREEERKRQELGLKQRGQINEFAGEIEGKGAEFRKNLAQNLSDTGQQFFNRLNPQILEDLNSRGLFTSQTARDQEQTGALADIARENEKSLMRFDTDLFNQVNDIRGTGLSAMLGGDQSALDAALQLRKAGIQRRFDEQDAAREQSFAEMMAKRQSRDNLISSIIGLGGSLGSSFLGGR